jgi:epoxyqueuosine reductase
MAAPENHPISCSDSGDKANVALGDLARKLKQQAGLLGFAEARLAPAVEPARYAEFLDWLDNGYAGEMNYLSERRDAYRHPDSILSGVRTILILALPYSTSAPTDNAISQGVGRIARYTSGTVDYHDWIHQRLKQLGRWLENSYRSSVKVNQEPIVWRGVVDTAPILEREFAQLSGLGWIGKNTLLLNRNLGSYFFLACLLTNLDLPCDRADALDHCGSCQACLNACPTQAFTEPHVLDATRCISYLTIEQRSLPSPELRSKMGDWLYGCDICQEVCPWNRKAPSLIETSFQPVPEFTELRLVEILGMNAEQFRQHFRRTPFWRAKRRGIIRNAALVSANQRAVECVPALKALLYDEEELIRAAAVWALTQMPLDDVDSLLASIRHQESSPLVQTELNRYFQRSDKPS